MKLRSMRAFVRGHRAEIDAAINRARTQYDKPGTVRKFWPMNDDDRHAYIINDAALYSWARSEGVED